MLNNFFANLNCVSMWQFLFEKFLKKFLITVRHSNEIRSTVLNFTSLFLSENLQKIRFAELKPFSQGFKGFGEFCTIECTVYGSSLPFEDLFGHETMVTYVLLRKNMIWYPILVRNSLFLIFYEIRYEIRHDIRYESFYEILKCNSPKGRPTF